jgi:hypothetical protein
MNALISIKFEPRNRMKINLMLKRHNAVATARNALTLCQRNLIKT